jgi:Complex1_LYR-like
MQQLGDAYVKSEFKLHKAVTQPEQVQRFFFEWERYLEQILLTARAQEAVSVGSLDVNSNNNRLFDFGRNLPHDVELTKEQREQLEKLRIECETTRTQATKQT